MNMKSEYHLHMLSFMKNDTINTCNVAFGDGANLQKWHLEILEEWLIEQKAKFDILSETPLVE